MRIGGWAEEEVRCPRVMGIPLLSVAANVYLSLRDKGGSQGFKTLGTQGVGCAVE